MKDIHEILTHFNGVKKTGGSYQCCCPAHDDKSPSLTITQEGGKILMHCHAGCDTSDILQAAGLTWADIGETRTGSAPTIAEQLESFFKKPLAETYDYTDESGHYLYSKARFRDKDSKTIRYFVKDEAQERIKHYSLKNAGVKHTLYNLKALCAAEENTPVFYVEGEKDVNTLRKLGYLATTAGGIKDWKKDYALYFKGRHVVILPDNDKPGLELKDQIIKDLAPVAQSVKWAITSKADKGDVTDYLNEGHTPEELAELIAGAKDANGEAFCTISLSDVEEKTPEWLITGYIPRGQITILAGDGGAGKTSAWCAIAAAVSSGKPSFLEQDIAQAFPARSPEKVFFLSTEDSIEHTLVSKLKKNGADMKNIKTLPISDFDTFSRVKFGSGTLESLIAQERPALMIFDPLQGFLDASVRMAERNAMRSALSSLISYGEKYGTTSLIVAHSNKQSSVYGRRRISDSADIWDIARSVLMLGVTEEDGTRYISQEKSNYAALSQTVLFSIENGEINFKSYTDKRDRDYVLAADYAKFQSPQRSEAKDFILDFLKDGERPVAELDETAEAIGISKATLKRAKTDLNKENRIRLRNTGSGQEKKHYISLTSFQNLSQ